MTTIIDGLRTIVGNPTFYQIINGEEVINYSAMLEYFFSCLILCIVVSSIFRILIQRFK